MRETVRFAALGDSVTYGIGDPLPGGGFRGWAAILGAALGPPGAVRVVKLASVGARAADVRRAQLDAALATRPTVASLVVGINDTLRSDFDAGRLHDDIDQVAAALTRVGALLLTVRLHDHSRVFRLPATLARPLRRRIDAVNAVYDDIAARHGALQLDLDAHPATYLPTSWHVDRLHPGERGHRLLARGFADLLLAAGRDLVALPSLEPAGGLPASRLADATWMVRQGVPWAARRSRDLLPYAARAAWGERAGRGAAPLRSPACLQGTGCSGPTGARMTRCARCASPAAGSTMPRARSSWSSGAPESSALRA